MPDDLSFDDVVGDIVPIIVCRGCREALEAFITSDCIEGRDFVEVDEWLGH